MVVLFSNISAIILSPIIVIGFQALFFYFRLSYFPNSVGLPTVEENSQIKYELIEKNILEDLKMDHQIILGIKRINSLI
jgi:sugar phosphate permease